MIKLSRKVIIFGSYKTLSAPSECRKTYLCKGRNFRKGPFQFFAWVSNPFALPFKTLMKPLLMGKGPGKSSTYEIINSISPNNYQYTIKRIGCENLKKSLEGKCFDLLSNSLNVFFIEMYRDQFGKFVCECWGLIG